MDGIIIKDLMSYKNYINFVYDCKFIISDSGTAQEEPALLNTKVIVPRDYTERPESLQYNCSYMIDVNTSNNNTWDNGFNYIDSPELIPNSYWLGYGNTANKIVEKLNQIL
jgi:UDP-N-acetylglucosamine 2-epimerase (non-hydrolysing)